MADTTYIDVWIVSGGKRRKSTIVLPEGGAAGKSAYQVAVDNGFNGTVNQWLASLIGAKGDTGTGTPGASGNDGLSAYQIAVNAGFSGTVNQWLASLVGGQGPKGDTGNTGPQGNPGSDATVTKAAVEAVLTGALNSHTHSNNPAFNSVYRTILDSSGSHIAAKAANTYGMGQGAALAVTGTGILYPLNVIYIDPLDYPTIDGKVSKLRIRATIECNDVAPFTGTFKVGLHPVTRPATSGGAGLCIYTIGSPVAGSQVTGTNLAADSQNNLVGADFDVPVAGWYIIGVVTSATMATSSHTHISAALQIHNV